MDPDERRQRLRQQMRNFYGARHASESQTLDAPKQAGVIVPPALDLDSELFNVSKYTTELLRHKSLKGLVETDTELLLSVSRLDRELQELVYRNYSKFISATDTIREMKDNVVQMESKLQALSSNVANIDKVSQGITEKLSEHRSRIEKTIATNLMLKKLQFLVDLPHTMRRLMDRGEYNLCVRCWVGGDGFLAKHIAVERIATIRSECHALAEELYGRLEAAMCAVSLDDPEAMDNIRRHVEDLRLLRCTAVLAETPLRGGEDPSFEEAILGVLMRGVVANFAKGAAAVLREIRAVLKPPRPAPPPGASAAALSNANLRESLAQLKTVCAILSVNTERVYSLMHRMDRAAVARRVAAAVEPVLEELLEPLFSGLAGLAWGCLQRIAEDGETVLAKPHLTGAAVIATVQALTRQLKSAIVAVRALGENYLAGGGEPPSGSGYAARVDRAVRGGFQRCLEELTRRAWEAPSRAALLGFREEASTSAPPSASASRVARLAFAAARFVYAAVATSLRDRCGAPLAQAGLLAAEGLRGVEAGLQAVATALHHRGILLIGALEVIDVAAGWGRGPPAPPTRPPDAIVGLMAEWATVEAVLQALPPGIAPWAVSPDAPSAVAALELFNPPPPPPPLYANPPTGRAAGDRFDPTPRRGGGGKLTLDYHPPEGPGGRGDAVFYASPLYHTTPWDGRPGTTMGCIVLYLLRALVDEVREVPSFDVEGFQRVQLDATCLLRVLLAPPKGTPPVRWSKHWGPSVKQAIQQQLNEIAASASERYPAKIPLADATVDGLVRSALHTMVSARESSPTAATSPCLPATSTSARDSTIETTSPSVLETTLGEEKGAKSNQLGP